MNLFFKMSIPIIAVFLIGVTFLTFRSYQMTADALYESETSIKSIAISESVNNLVRNYEFDAQNAKSLSQTALFQPYLTGTPLEFQQNQVDAKARVVNMGNTYGYYRVGLANKDGLVLRDSDDKIEGTSLADQSFFKAALGGRPASSPPFQSSGKTVYIVAHPVFKGTTNEVVGVAYVVPYVDTSINEHLNLGSESFFMVTNQYGKAFIHSNRNQEFVFDLNNLEWGKEIYSRKDGQLSFSISGKEKSSLFMTSPELGWSVIAVTDLGELRATSREIGSRSFLLALGVLAVLMVVVSLTIRVIVSSIKQAVAYSQNISSGNLSAELNIRSNDEIGELAKSLRHIPVVLNSIITEYKDLEVNIRNGALLTRGDQTKYEGEYSNLVSGTNNILDSFLTVIDNIPSPVVVLNNKLEAQYLNKVATKISTQHYHGKKCIELFRREDDSTPEDGLQKALQTKVPCSGETIAHPDAGSLDIVYTAIPLLNANKEISSVLQLVTDVTSFKQTQKTIMSVAERTTTISNQLATALGDLATQIRSTENSVAIQSQKVSVASETMENMNSVVMDMAISAKEASEVSTKAKQEAVSGNQVVQQTVTSIQKVSDQSNQLKTAMEKLDTSASAINEVITTISDIADQTNLLALNAAIEAARAGESGRGFAVVADEVRKLAEKTMSSTIEVQEAISNIQGSVTQSVSLVNSSASAVEQTSELVTRSGEAFLSIVDLVEETVQKTYVISNSSDEQSKSSLAVNTILSEVDGLSRETANGMKEATLAVSELSTQGNNLSELISELKQ